MDFGMWISDFGITRGFAILESKIRNLQSEIILCRLMQCNHFSQLKNQNHNDKILFFCISNGISVL